MRKETVKITCDRCGKEIPDWFSPSFYIFKNNRKIIMTRDTDRGQKEIDLCKDCYESLRHWYFRKDEREVK